MHFLIGLVHTLPKTPNHAHPLYPLYSALFPAIPDISESLSFASFGDGMVV
jgi:hypothetical protein